MNSCLTTFVDDFQWAVIRLATLRAKQEESGRLIFASVTLLSSDRPPPNKMNGIEHRSLGKSGMTVSYRRTVLTAQAAIDWYRGLGKGNSQAPVPSREEDIEEYDRASIIVPPLVDSPLWPNLGLPMVDSLLSHPTGRSNPAPFIGNQSARVHRRFGDSSGFEILLANDKGVAFLARRLHITLSDYPEYLGSVALVVPDPIIKQIDNFLLPSRDGKGERIFYRFVPKVGKTLAGLRITMFDDEANLLTNFESRGIPDDGILELDKGYCSGTYGYVVTHPVHGILAYHPPSSFIRQIGFNMGVVNQVRKVSVPLGESPKSPQTEYRVHRLVNDRSSVIGEEPDIPNVNVRVGMAARKREKAANALRYDQHWFGDGSREQAMAFIRTRVGRAKSLIVVADPYFGVLQIPQYLLAITSDNVKVKILTSRLAFEGVYAPENADVGSTLRSQSSKLIERLERFNSEIARVRREGNSDIEVMVLPGKSPALHDRFLVIDDEVWFLGNSLNALGERASMIIKLPNPDEVLTELDKMLNQADSFETYHQRRVAAQTRISK